MAFTVTLAGQTFTDESFAGTAYADEETGFPAALQKIVEHVSGAWSATSSTSLTIGTGAKSLTATAGKAFTLGQPVTIARTSDPAGTQMAGYVTAYNSTSGALSVTVVATRGSGGPFTDWTVSAGGVWQYQTVSTPVAIADGGTGATNAATALANLGGLGSGDALIPGNNLSDVDSVSTSRTNLGLGTVATLDAGTGANNAVQLNGSAELPAVSGANLTSLNASNLASGSVPLARISQGAGSTLDADTVDGLHASEIGQGIISGQSGGSDGKVLRLSSANTWTTAAKSDTASQLLGLVFRAGGVYYAPGTVVSLAGLTAGNNYWLDTAGNLTTTAPTPASSVRQVYIGKAISSSSLLFIPGQPIQAG